jgi:hypothetical protein
MPETETHAALASRTVSNTVFVLGARVVSRVVSLVVIIVLANALGPDGSAPVGEVVYLAAIYLLRAVDPEELSLLRGGLARVTRRAAA